MDAPIPTTDEIEQGLNDLPDLVADALLEWRKATIFREKEEALLYLRFKNDSSEKRTVPEIQALVESSDARYQCRLKESVAESDYERIKERLLCTKKRADLRTTF